MYAMVVDKHIELTVVCVSVVDAIEVCVAILLIVYPWYTHNEISSKHWSSHGVLIPAMV